MAKLLEKSYQLPALDFSGPYVPFDQTEHGKAMNELQERSDSLPEGEIVDGIVSFGVADGGAYYLVVKEKPLTLQHIDFLDGYRAHPALIRGLTRDDICFSLDGRRRMKALFRGVE